MFKYRIVTFSTLHYVDLQSKVLLSSNQYQQLKCDLFVLFLLLYSPVIVSLDLERCHSSVTKVHIC